MVIVSKITIAGHGISLLLEHQKENKQRNKLTKKTIQRIK